jgi:hypothetical protein
MMIVVKYVLLLLGWYGTCQDGSGVDASGDWRRFERRRGFIAVWLTADGLVLLRRNRRFA